ncbi:unnamed protein product [Enterobius vermicularis]|uniref:Col_cuticle_N domain-containing protein n=1 Tax=Enterobius vermicularis TaxID=51028 RepID=A0A0N4V053_ENTVE|nr:unnamed protein product [Enterobius vermicularis]
MKSAIKKCIGNRRKLAVAVAVAVAIAVAVAVAVAAVAADAVTIAVDVAGTPMNPKTSGLHSVKLELCQRRATTLNRFTESSSKSESQQPCRPLICFTECWWYQ